MANAEAKTEAVTHTPGLPTFAEIAAQRIADAGPRDKTITIKVAINTARMMVESETNPRAGATPTLAPSTKSPASRDSAALGPNSGFDSRDGGRADMLAALDVALRALQITGYESPLHEKALSAVRAALSRAKGGA